MNIKNKIKLLGLISFIVVTILFIITYILRDRLSEVITTEIRFYGLLLVFIITALSEILPQYIGPELILIQSLVLGLPRLEMLSVIIAGTIIGSVIGFELGRKYGMPLVLKIYNYEKVQSLERKTDKYGKWIILIAAVTPAPYFPIIFGSLGIKRKTLTFYGIIPRVIALGVISLFL